MPVFLDPPVDLGTIVDDGTYQDVDITTHVGSDAGSIAMAIIEVEVPGASPTFYALRENGSTDDRFEELEEIAHQWHCIGCDANDIFEVKFEAETTDNKIYLHGYWTTAEAASITNGVDHSVASINSWLDIDITADVVSGVATGAAFQVIRAGGGGGFVLYDFRINGSTDDRRNQGVDSDQLHGFFVGLDANEICEMNVNEALIDCFLVGYSLSNFTGIVNNNEYSHVTNNVYAVKDLSPDIPAGNNGCMLNFNVTNNTVHKWTARKNGQTRDIYQFGSLRIQGIIEIDTDRKIEVKSDSSAADTWLMGYTAAPAAAGGRIMSSLAGAGGLASAGGIAGYGGGLAG